VAQKKIEKRECQYNRCSLCDVSYVSMLQFSLNGPDYLLLCKTCFEELKSGLDTWGNYNNKVYTVEEKK